MGSIGASRLTEASFVNKNVAELSSRFEYQEGRSFSDIYKDMREIFKIPEASEKQLDTLRQIFRSMEKYDKDYTEEKKPYTITGLSVHAVGTHSEEEKQLFRDAGMRVSRPLISVMIHTEPNVDNAYVKLVDAKTRSALIGPNGGFVEYDKNYKRRAVKNDWDIRYGKSSYER